MPSFLERHIPNCNTIYVIYIYIHRYTCMCILQVLQLCPTFCNPLRTVARQAPLSMGFSRQEYWSGLPCLPPRGPSQTRDRTCVSRILLCKTGSTPPVPPEKPFCIFGFVTNQTKTYWLGTATTSQKWRWEGGTLDSSFHISLTLFGTLTKQGVPDI